MSTDALLRLRVLCRMVNTCPMNARFLQSNISGALGECNNGNTFSHYFEMLRPEGDNTGMSSEIIPSRLYMPHIAYWPGCDLEYPESDPAGPRNFIRSELPTGLAHHARGRPIDGGSWTP